jgi:hypothetical protein
MYNNVEAQFKGTGSRDFLFQDFYINQFPPKPLIILLGPLKIFFETFAEIFVAPFKNILFVVHVSLWRQ